MEEVSKGTLLNLFETFSNIAAMILLQFKIRQNEKV